MSVVRTPPRLSRRISAKRNPDPAEVAALVKTCEKLYPPANVGLSILTLGITGVTRKDRRNACLAAAKAGKPDPRTGVSPTTLPHTTPEANDPYHLWSIKAPWTARPVDTAGNTAYALGLKTGGDRLRSMAKGWRPPTSGEFYDLERKATILGGILTLKTLGIEPWTSIPLPQTPLKLSNDPSGPFLVNQVRIAAQKQGKPLPTELSGASGYVRDRVVEANAGGPAWFARAMYLTLAASTATDKRSKIEGAVSTGASVAAKAAYASAAGATGTIIGAPVGAVLGVVGGVMDGVSIGVAALSGRSTIESARADGEAMLYAADFQNELEARSFHIQQDLVQQQIELVEKTRELVDEASMVQAAQITRAITATVWVTVFGSTGLLTYAAVKALRRRQRRHSHSRGTL